MTHKLKIQKIIRILITSRFYFYLPLRERLDFLKNIARKHPASLKKLVSCRGIGMFLRSDR